MPAKHSAGILLYRKAASGSEVLIVHPGGPFWAKKDMGSWSMPKGEFDPDEDALHAAKREFKEETGLTPPEGNYLDLGEVKQPSGKIVRAFALEADVDLKNFKSNLFELEWPPKSDQKQQFPEADKAAWTPLNVAAQRLVKGQVPFLTILADQLGQNLEDEVVEPQISLF
jgi:predicted NUDIX family NTP pyrophosphohydrolase